MIIFCSFQILSALWFVFLFGEALGELDNPNTKPFQAKTRIIYTVFSSSILLLAQLFDTIAGTQDLSIRVAPVFVVGLCLLLGKVTLTPICQEKYRFHEIVIGLCNVCAVLVLIFGGHKYF